MLNLRKFVQHPSCIPLSIQFRTLRIEKNVTLITSNEPNLEKAIHDCVHQIHDLSPPFSFFQLYVDASYSNIHEANIKMASQSLQSTSIMGTVVDQIIVNDESRPRRPRLLLIAHSLMDSSDYIPFMIQSPQLNEIRVGRWMSQQPSADMNISEFNSISQPRLLTVKELPKSLQDSIDLGEQYAMILATDGCRESLSILRSLDYHFPCTLKMGLCGTSTPFINHLPFTLFYQNQILDRGIVGLLIRKKAFNIHYRFESNIQPISPKYRIMSCRGNLIFTIDDMDPVKVLSQLIQSHFNGNERMSKEDIIYARIFNLTGNEYSQYQVTGSGSSPPSLSINTHHDLTTHQSIQFFIKSQSSLPSSEKNPFPNYILESENGFIHSISTPMGYQSHRCQTSSSSLHISAPCSLDASIDFVCSS